ncbi:MAG: response regulator [Crocinitomicaceae bacterium]|jgi:DNA-binding NtrC family response regulator|nr:response regulator [Crocinitomicaceae bacterium]MEE3164344.1 sigma-54 dependent transcriptional regulator [Bacteroidota bacterium]
MKKSPKILIIDDEAPIRASLKEILEYENYQVMEAEDGAEGLKLATKFAFDVVFCDIKMPKMDGLEVLDALVEKGIDGRVIMISGHGTVETAVQAIKVGAFDFIQKPLDLNRILLTVRHALDQGQLEQETERLTRKIQTERSTAIVGDSPAIREIVELICTVAPSDARVLITGANGTGKELVARQLHELSARHNAPFIEVNCAAIPSELIESELFGHEKGAFTSAVKQRKGKFEQAQGGTLFLDEIGDMSASAQAKVLRALQENRISRVGGEKEIEVDVRVVAATNKDLRAEIAEGNFREDLYHRLAVIPVHVPALNDRRDDVPLLVTHFLKIICEQHGKVLLDVKDDAMASLQSANWTGNIRELRNVVERLVILTPKGGAIDGALVQRFGGLSA